MILNVWGKWLLLVGMSINSACFGGYSLPSITVHFKMHVLFYPAVPFLIIHPGIILTCDHKNAGIKNFYPSIFLENFIMENFQHAK